MKKVFHDAHRWKKKWFRKLGPRGRDVWNWVLDNSDHGIWEVDTEAIAFDLGYAVELSEIKMIFGGRMHEVGDGKVFLPAVVVFQYGELSESCNPHKPVLRDLKKYNLMKLYQEELIKSSGTLKDKDKNKDKEKGECEGENKTPLSPPPLYPTADDLKAAIPIITRAKWQKDYPDSAWLDQQIGLAFDFHSADPAKRPATAGQWAKKLVSWLASGWQKKIADDMRRPKLTGGWD